MYIFAKHPTSLGERHWFDFMHTCFCVEKLYNLLYMYDVLSK